ncbi:MAG TPA: phosphoribosylanthranilate isomerase [Longimicrobiales bacterium]|nr:phosphoribosylanthranilate isomerase [Longimicrobiales bacterium]
MTSVKVCGLCRPEDAAAAVAAGASYVGVILSAHGPRALDEARARAVLAERGAARAVGVFVDEPLDRIVACAERLRLGALQLHGRETIADVGMLRSRTDASIWKSVRVRDARGAREAVAAWTSHVDGLLLDGWSPHAAGGTGTAFEWEALHDVRALVPEHVTLVVAGGLSAENVARAIEVLAPDVVDVSSGVETGPGEKSEEKIRAFVAAARMQRKEAAT